MLQKIAQDRLDKVLSIIETSNFRFANKEISESLGIGKGTVSDYLSGAKPMSKPFFELFMKKYSNGSVTNVDAGANKSTTKSGKNEDFGMQETIRNLSESNINLAIAFVKQATAHEKEADARIIQATANRLLVEVNKETLAKIPTPLSAKERYTQDSQLMTRTLDVMAKALVRHGVYQSDEEATLYLGKLLTSEAEEETFLNKNQQAGTQNKHKA